MTHQLLVCYMSVPIRVSEIPLFSPRETQRGQMGFGPADIY